MFSQQIFLVCIKTNNHKNAFYKVRNFFLTPVLFFGLFLTVLTIFFAGCLPFNLSLVPKAEAEPQGFVFVTNSLPIQGKPSVTILGYTGTNQTVSIPRTLGGLPVTHIGSRAFYSCGLTKVIIGNGVTCIGNSAFANTRRLDSVVLGASVTNIGAQAFAYGLNIKSFDVDKQNTSYCSMNGVLFDKGMTKLIQYPNGRAGSYEIPDGVTRIGDSAFWGCYHITSIMIPDSVTHIDSNAFDSCSRITSLRIGKNITHIGNGAFMYCENLASIDLPERLVHIGNASFAQCRILRSITIPNSVTHIGNGAFGTCHQLTDVTMGGSVTYIGYSVFMECRSLTSIKWPSSASVIEENAFSYCWALTDVTLPEGVSIIKDLAFRGCTKLSSITVPSTVTEIGLGIFEDCPGLKDIYFRGNAPRIRGSKWARSDNITVHYLPGKSGWGATFCGRPTKISEE